MLNQAGQSRVNPSRQYDQTIEMAGHVEPQLVTIYEQDPLTVHWNSITRREQDVLARICLGDRNRDIADLLGIAPGTVKGHIENILRKLHAKNRTEIRIMFRDWDFQTWWMEHHISASPAQHPHR